MAAPGIAFLFPRVNMALNSGVLPSLLGQAVRLTCQLVYHAEKRSSWHAACKLARRSKAYIRLHRETACFTRGLSRQIGLAHGERPRVSRMDMDTRRVRG